MVQRLWNVTRAHGWQGFGGGLRIDGTATLTNTNVYDNQADYVSSPFELFHPAPLAGTLLVLMVRAGRGALHPGHGDADKHQREPE